MKTLLPALVFFVSPYVLSENENFEGIITYSFVLTDSLGEKAFFPQEEQQVLVTRNQIITHQTRGYLKQISDSDLILDIEKNKRFEVNHTEQKVYELEDMKPDTLPMIEIPSDETSVILGRKCIVRTFKIVNKYERDTTQQTYWLDPTMPVANLKAFAALQAYRSTMLMDGRLLTVPLKIVSRRGNGKILAMEATAIEKRKITSRDFKIPDYPVERK